MREADPRRPAAASGKRTGLRGPRQALSAAAPSRRASLFVAVNRSQPADLPVPRLGTSTSSALAVSTPSVSGPGRGDGVTGLPRRSRSGEGGHLVVSKPSTCYGRHRPGSSLESGVVRREAAVPVTSTRLCGRSKWRPNCRGAWWRWWPGRPRGPRAPRAPVRPAAASRAHSSSVSLFCRPRGGSVAGVLSLGGSTFPPQPGRTRCEVTPHGSRMFQNTTLFLSCPVVPGKNNVSRSHRWGRSGAVRGPSGAPQNFGICRRHRNGSSFFLPRPAGPGGPSRAPR